MQRSVSTARERSSCGVPFWGCLFVLVAFLIPALSRRCFSNKQLIQLLHNKFAHCCWTGSICQTTRWQLACLPCVFDCFCGLVSLFWCFFCPFPPRNSLIVPPQKPSCTTCQQHNCKNNFAKMVIFIIVVLMATA